MVNALGVIPARKDSTRFPNKILAPILNKPMIQYVWEATKQSRLLGRCVVATDCENIAHTVVQFGGEVLLTPTGFESGTERVAWVARQISADVIVNIKGDEPLLSGNNIDCLIEDLIAHPDADIATLATQVTAGGESTHIVKVLCDAKGWAQTFCRTLPDSFQKQSFLKHIGIYAYRRIALEKFSKLPMTYSESQERLEQLRALENGMKIRVVTTATDTIAVDVPTDIERVENFLRGL